MRSGPKSCPDLEELYDKIYRYCYFRLSNKDLAEDLTQEAFLRFLTSESYHESGQALQYLYSIARNLCIDEYRRKKPVPLTEETWSELVQSKPPPMEDKLITSLALRSALSHLDREEQELLLLRYVNEVPAAVICRLFVISRFALYRKTAKALKQLKALLEESL